MYAILSVLSWTWGATSHLRPVSSATVLRDPSWAWKTDTRHSEASAISASTAGETIRHSWVFASSPLFRKGPTAWTNTGPLMNGVCHCEWERLGRGGRRVSKRTMQDFGMEMAKQRVRRGGDGWEGARWCQTKLWRAFWKMLLRCVIFADVHYSLARG